MSHRPPADKGKGRPDRSIANGGDQSDHSSMFGASEVLRWLYKRPPRRPHRYPPPRFDKVPNRTTSRTKVPLRDASAPPNPYPAVGINRSTIAGPASNESKANFTSRHNGKDLRYVMHSSVVRIATTIGVAGHMRILVVDKAPYQSLTMRSKGYPVIIHAGDLLDLERCKTRCQLRFGY